MPSFDLEWVMPTHFARGMPTHAAPVPGKFGRIDRRIVCFGHTPAARSVSSSALSGVRSVSSSAQASPANFGAHDGSELVGDLAVSGEVRLKARAVIQR